MAFYIETENSINISITDSLPVTSLINWNDGKLESERFTDIKIFDCSYNKITSLAGIPKKVDSFFCQNNKLTNLIDCPDVHAKLICSENPLTSLEGCPEELGTFECDNTELISYEFMPKKIHLNSYLGSCNIQSFTGIGQYFRDGFIGGHFIIPDTLTTAILGLLLIPKLENIQICERHGQVPFNQNLTRAVTIINKYLKTNRNIIDCQRELIRAGLKDYAKL